jgi:lipopolysaccharide export system permease protein
MVFKRIDRYVTWRFLIFLAGMLCLLGFLYGSFDLLKKVEDLRQAEMSQEVSLLAQYYAYVLPLFLVDIVPALVLVSAGMVLVQMARTRELLVLKASGISVYRMVAPVFLAAFIISMLGFTFQQTLAPGFARQKELLDRKIQEKVETELLIQDPTYNQRLFVGLYDYADQSMQVVRIITLYPGDKLRVKAVVQADSARLLPDGKLQMEGVVVQNFDQTGTPQPLGPPSASQTVQTGLDPFDFVRASQESGEQTMVLQTLGELRDQIRRNPNVPGFQVVYHSRLASIFSPIILLLIGVPCLIGFEQSVRSRFLGAIISIVVAAGFYALGFILSSMGSTETVNPVLAGWLPSIIGGSVGLWLFQGMHT